MLNRIGLVALSALLLAALAGALGYAYCDVKHVSGIVHGPDGQPIANAALTLGGRSTFSDGAGHFAIASARGNFTLTGFAAGFDSAQTVITTEDLLQKNFAADLTLRPNVFTATVFAADTRRPLAGATVQADAGRPLTTDARGQFAARGVTPGARFTVSASGYRSAVLVYSPQGPAELALPPALTRVTVTDAYTQAPLPNSLIRVDGQAAQTDAQGLAVLRALSSGAVVSAQAPNYESESVSSDGGSALSLALRPTTLDGTVLDTATHQPIPTARILYNGQVVETDANGAYHLDPAPPELQLTVKVPGYRLTSFAVKDTAHFDLPLSPFQAKGLHIYYGMPRADVLALLDRVQGSAVNAVVLDVKEGPGDIVWDSQVPLAQQIGAYHAVGIPPGDLVALCRARRWYCIARMVVFKDSRLGQARPDLALHYPGGGLLNDGTAIWVNPAKHEVWDYDIALAKELSALGFDEVQLDYIRYPGRPAPLENGTPESRVQTIQTFVQTISHAFRDQPAFLSADIFGLTTATHEEAGIGQLLEAIAPGLDYISPMLYPSTWSGSPNLFQSGLGLPHCPGALACPYDIIYRGTLLAQQRVKTLVRPWLQAYGDTGFGLAQYIRQRQGAEDANSAGWIFWNNQGLYDVTMFGK